MIRKYLPYLIGIVFLVYFFRKPLTSLYLKRQTGMQAIQDAATATGYTTYNQTPYSSPFWAPALKYFRANAYVPTGSSGQNGGSDTASYSTIQG